MKGVKSNYHAILQHVATKPVFAQARPLQEQAGFSSDLVVPAGRLIMISGYAPSMRSKLVEQGMKKNS